MIISGFCTEIGARLGSYTARGFGPLPPIPVPIAELAYWRLRRVEIRFRAFVARFYAGLLRTHPTRAKPTAPRASRATTPPIRLKGTTRFGWLAALTVHEGAALANQLRHLLSDPEMQKLLAAGPQAARILRPTCRMLGIEKALLTPVGQLSEAQSATATLTPSDLQEAPEPPPPRIPGVLPWGPHLILWRPQNNP